MGFKLSFPHRSASTFRHGNFVSSSSLIMQTTRLDGSLMANVNPTTANNFTQILRLLAGLLSQGHASYDSRYTDLLIIIEHLLKFTWKVLTALHTD